MPHLSFSQVKSFAECARRWKYGREVREPSHWAAVAGGETPLPARLQSLDAFAGDAPPTVLELWALNAFKAPVSDHPIDSRWSGLEDFAGFFDRHCVRLHAPSLSRRVPFVVTDTSVMNVTNVIILVSDRRRGRSMKTCSKCGETKALAEFSKSAMHQGGHHVHCKSCRYTQGQAWRAANRERQRETERKRRQSNPEPFRAAQKRYRETQGDVVKERDRVRYTEQRDHILARKKAARDRRPERYNERSRLWKAAHPEKVRAIHARYREQHRELYTEAQRRRRARKAGVGAERVDRAAIIRRDKSICWMCGRALKPGEVTLDHLWPLSKGGPHAAWNLKVACKPCNSRRQAGRVPAQPLLIG